MPAVSLGVAQSTARTAFDQRRRSARRSCRLQVILRTSAGDWNALLLEISAEGFGIHADSLVRLRPGQPVSLVTPQLGVITSIVRWATPPRYGAEFTAAGNTLARVQSFYDSLPPAPSEMF